jgi:uncharacterized RDD family membrane protein YckC
MTSPSFYFPNYDPIRPEPPLIRPAPFWRRLVARLIDFAIALPLAFVLVIPVVIIMAPVWLGLSGSGIDDWENRIWGPVGGSVCLFLSFVVLELFLLVNRSGQTLGKGLMRIKVIRTDERPLTVVNSSARLLANMLAVTADRKFRRAAHDYAARTRVVMAGRRPIKFADVKLMAPKVNMSKRVR